MFDGKVAVVTGGAQGLGRAIVELLVQRGATVHAIDVDEPALEALAARLGARVRGHRADVSDEAAVLAARRAIVGDSGRVDILQGAARSSALARLPTIASRRAGSFSGSAGGKECWLRKRFFYNLVSRPLKNGLLTADRDGRAANQSPK